MKTIKKITTYLFIILFTAILFTGFYTIFKGYSMYLSVINKVDISEKVDQIKENPGYTEYDDISETFLNALVAVEDHRFFIHQGIDLISLIRVTVTNLKRFSLAEGGSTITQQLARNMYFTQEKKFSRKIAEALVATDLEKNYNKKTILELYANIIYFGNGLYGIAQASQEYFNVLPSELTFSQAVYLAGFP